VAKLGLIRGGLIGHWRHPLRAVYDLLKTGYKEGRVSGDMLYTGYCTNALLYCMFVAGEPLDVVDREATRYLEFQTRTKDFDASRTFVVHQRMVRLLQGRTAGTDTVSDDEFDEAAFVETLNSLVMKIPLCLFHTWKLMASTLFGHVDAALQHADEALALKDSSAGLAFSSEYQRFHALNVLIHHDQIPAPQRRRRLREARGCIKQIRKWAEHSPTTFVHRLALLDAESARLRGDTDGALGFFDQAIEGARANGFPQDEAVACERAGRFHASAGRARVARFYLMDAVHAYGRWGATAKVAQQEREFPEIRRGESGPAASVSSLATVGSASTTSVSLDFHTVVKAMQAMSGEIEMSKLLAVMMQIVIENAGAQRGTLLLRRDGELRVQATGPDADGGYGVLQGTAVDPAALPASIVSYVERSGDSVLLPDAAESPEHALDPYVAAARPRSVLCAPVTHHGELVGVLYLENNLQPGAFTARRLQTLGLLTSQIAISLENARLYDQQREMAMSFSRFVPRQFLQLLGRESLLKVALGDSVERDISVLFSDIRSSTALSEQMTPEQNFAFLNRYLGGVGPAIRRHGGFIDKYIGDAVMALFPSEPADALHAAVSMQRFVGEFNGQQEVAGRAPIAIGIGLHSGRVMLGTIGEAERLEGTVISDAVNIASRLEGLTKAFGAGVIVSGPMLEQVSNPSRFEHRFLGNVQLRGRRVGVPLFEVFEHEPDDARDRKKASRATFEDAVRAAIDGRWADAVQGFEAVLAEDPGDRAAGYHLRGAQEQRQAGGPAPG